MGVSQIRAGDAADAAFVEAFRAGVEADLADAGRWVRRWLARVALVSFAAIGVTALVSTLYHFHMGGAVSATTVALMGSEGMRLATEFRKRAAARLDDAGDPRLLGPLAHYAEARRAVVRDSARKALIRVAPKVTARERPLITNAEMAALLHVLGRIENAELTVALLGALRCVGDGRAIPSVRRLAALNQGAVITDWSDKIRSRIARSAQDCLPYLEAQAERDRQRATLLRASTDAAPAGAALLRPAASASSAAETLPRATAPPDATQQPVDLEQESLV